LFCPVSTPIPALKPNIVFPAPLVIETPDCEPIKVLLLDVDVIPVPALVPIHTLLAPVPLTPLRNPDK
jgi:hypothetical protein